MEKHTYDDTNVIKTWHEVYRFADTDARDAISDCEDAITQNSAAIISLGGKIPESVVGDVDLTSSGLEKKVNGEWQHVGYPSSILNDGLVTGVSYNSQSNQLHVSKYGQANAEILQLPNDVKDVSYDSASHALTFKFDGGLPDKVITLPSNADITEGVVDDVSKSGDNLIISYVGDKQDKTIPLGIPTGDTGGKVDSVTYASGTNTTTVTNKDGTSNTFHVESGGRVDGLSMDSANNRIQVTTRPYTSSTATSSYVTLPNYVNDVAYNSTNNQLTIDYAGGKTDKVITLAGSSGGSAKLLGFVRGTATKRSSSPSNFEMAVTYDGSVIEISDTLRIVYVTVSCAHSAVNATISSYGINYLFRCDEFTQYISDYRTVRTVSGSGYPSVSACNSEFYSLGIQSAFSGGYIGYSDEVSYVQFFLYAFANTNTISASNARLRMGAEFVIPYKLIGT